MLSYTRLCQNYSSRISEFLVTSDIRIRKDIAVNRKGIKNNKHIQTISLDICHSFSLVKRWDIRASAFSRHSCLRMLDGVFQLIYLSEQEREREREREFPCTGVCIYCHGMENCLDRRDTFHVVALLINELFKNGLVLNLLLRKKFGVLNPSCRRVSSIRLKEDIQSGLHRF